MFRIHKAIAAACIGASLWILGSYAQADEVVQLVVGFPPGQSVDVVGRMLADRLAPVLGKKVIVENRPGQGGSIALASVAKMPPDGNTITLAALASLVANPHLYKNVHYQTLKDFQPIGLVYNAPLVLVVNPSLPVKSVAELVAYAKAHPGKLAFSSSGNGTVSHLGMVDFEHRAGINMLHVPYQGSVKAMTDLVGGRVQVGMDTVPATQTLLKAGKLRLLAVCSPSRLSVFPDTPTVAEEGFPGFEAVAWVGLLAPAGTPKDFVDKVNGGIAALESSKKFVRLLTNIGLQSRFDTPEDFASYLRSEYAKWGELVRISGARID